MLGLGGDIEGPACWRKRPAKSRTLAHPSPAVGSLPEPILASIVTSMITLSSRMRIVESGRESFADISSGIAYFRSAGAEHDVFNAGGQEMVFVEVEFMS
jgi:hypothetical protein